MVIGQNHCRHRAARRSSLYSPAVSMNRATGALEQLKCLYIEELRYPGYQMLSHPDIGDAALDRQLFTYLEQPIALVPARLNYPQGYIKELGLPGHIGELGLPGHKGELEYPGHIGELGHTGE